jgi:hypothetical protein
MYTSLGLAGGHVLRNPNTPKSFDTTHMHPSSIQHDVFCLLRLKFSRLGKEKKGWSGGGMVLEKRGGGAKLGHVLLYLHRACPAA